MLDSIFSYFTDPVLRAPTLASMLMCLASALIGVIVFIRKRSLLGEALSHAAYPGVVLSVILFATFFPQFEEGMPVAILVGAFLSALLGLWVVDLLERRLRIKQDAALCFVLSVFFGLGILIASRVQVTHALWFKQIQSFLYGQAATMTDGHILLYGSLAVLTILGIYFLYRQIEIVNFDREYAKSVGANVSLIDTLFFLLLVLAICIGIRSVGVVLMSGMLIAPAVAARQFTNRLSTLFILAGFFGVASGFLGNYLSMTIPQIVSSGEGTRTFSLPTGPMILLTASSFCLLALLFAPSRGVVSRYVRIVRFRDKCSFENALKAFWRRREEGHLAKEEIRTLGISWLLLKRMLFQGWVRRDTHEGYHLTQEGKIRAANIVRLHRLWEVYLVHMGQGVEKVHHSAEEMEHILTPDLERRLTEFLQDPKHDPHLQPIPRGDV